MVALLPVPLDCDVPDPSIADDDLVIALPADAGLDRAGADALVELASNDRADAWFGDITISGRLVLRGAWSPTRLIADPLAAWPLAVRAGWLRANQTPPGAAGLPFRLVEGGADVVHMTAVLTHHDREPRDHDPSEVNAHLERVGVPATVDRQGRLEPTGAFTPEVSLVIPTAGAALDDTPAVGRLLERLGPLPAGVETILVTGDEFRGDPAWLEGPGRSIVHRPPGPFNFSSAVNLGILHARSSLVLLLNDDTEPDGPEFLRRMAVHLSDASVAAVGALLTYPDGTVQHAGIVIDDARPLHPFVGWDPASTTPHGGLLARDVVAVTGGCLMARRDDLLAVGGLSTGFPLSFNDVDLCVRLRRSIGRVVIEPAATLLHHETLSREPAISADEWDRWIDRWGEIVDPWYHPRHHRPDDPRALSRNADHLPPDDGAPVPPVTARRPTLRSRVHRGRPATAPH